LNLRLSLGICLALLFSGSGAAGAALPDLRAARSLVAEAALLLQLDQHHRLARPYVRESQSIIRDQLQSELENLGPGSREAGLVGDALGALQRHDRQRLERVQQALTDLVDEREKAD
jgi:hypothetical protein